MDSNAKEYIYINSIMDNPSLCDGFGYRTVVFFQGCNFHCKGCHNQSTWDITKGKKIEVHELAEILKAKSFNKKITISGGEPLLQEKALISLLDELNGYDICVYTGHKLEDVSKEILKRIKYIKVGQYKEELRTTTKPFVGSTNQEFLEVSHLND